MNNYIQVNNFRKYISTPEVELNDLNFFVGSNSSGKSTFVKAFLLLATFIKEDQIFEIDFSSPLYKDVNIQDFNRQICKYSNKGEHVNFKLALNDFVFELTLVPHQKSNYARVLKYHVTDLVDDIRYEYDFSKGNVVKDIDYDENSRKWIDSNIIVEHEFKIRLINNHKYKDMVLSILEYLIAKENNAEKIISLTHDLDVLKNTTDFEDSVLGNSFGMFTNSLIKERDNVTSLSTGYEVSRGLELNISIDQIMTFYRLLDVNNKGTKAGAISINSLFEEDAIHLGDGLELSTKKDKLINTIQSFNLTYLPLTFRKYTNLNSIIDKSNDLAQLVHNYYNLDSNISAKGYEFIKYWIGKDQFNIGDDFEINFYGGEAYEILIIESDIKIPLIDKGTGNIQVFKILLTIASVQTVRPQNLTVILEEPELNLHPSLQSKLADLIVGAEQTFGIRFMVETHSEYLIRRLQVLACQEKLNREKLAITYFPTEQNLGPYQLRIIEDGSLDRNFGPGFFDEASHHTLELIKFRRLRYN